MTTAFTGLVMLGGWLDGSLTAAAPDRAVQGTLFCVLICVVMVGAVFELERMSRATGAKVFSGVVSAGVVLLAGGYYLLQFVDLDGGVYFLGILGLIVPALFLRQYLSAGFKGTVVNCGVSLFFILYLGGLSGFVTAMRVEFGIWPTLMFVFVVKGADIGAYAIGKPFGRHKFSPRLSPNKSWEGMAGGVFAAVLIGMIVSVSFDIMTWWQGGIFGILFSFIGQLGDLAESMIKRDTEQKDSANKVPGFGGLLDLIDSPLMAAPFGCLYFLMV